MLLRRIWRRLLGVIMRSWKGQPLLSCLSHTRRSSTCIHCSISCRLVVGSRRSGSWEGSGCTLQCLRSRILLSSWGKLHLSIVCSWGPMYLSESHRFFLELWSHRSRSGNFHWPGQNFYRWGQLCCILHLHLSSNLWHILHKCYSWFMRIQP